jgi:hypothetical protein
MQSKVATSQGRHNSEIQTWDSIRVVSPMAILKNNSPQNWEISILMSKKARTRLKHFLEVKARLPDKDSQTRTKKNTKGVN